MKKNVFFSFADTSAQKEKNQSAKNIPCRNQSEGAIVMTTTGAQYALAASTGAGNNSGGNTAVGVDSKANIVVVTTSNSNGNTGVAQTHSTRGRQLITVVTSADPSSPSNLQPIQVSFYNSIK